ncbi:TPA: hypothetical protein DCF80_02040 [Candidatus Saccharibacteria bacterium]|nr:hypothetical protein [Candidatus Saccharibacteria bacterium]
MKNGKRSKQAKRSQKEKTGFSMSGTLYPTPAEVRKKLEAMVANPDMITLDAYSPDTESYPDNRISFIEQHMRYLRTHKHVDPNHYMSNLSLMIKKR